MDDIAENLFTCFSQLLPSVLVLLPGFTGGAAISYGAVALPHYMDLDNDSGLVMTKDQATWFSKCLLYIQYSNSLLQSASIHRCKWSGIF